MDADTGPKDPILTVNHWIPKGIGIFGALFFLFGAIGGFYTKQPLVGIFFLIFSAYSFFVFLLYGKTEMDKKAILQKSIIGSFKIKWYEVKGIEVDAGGNSIVFKGENKQLVIPGRSFWTGKDKKQMIELFNAQIEEKGLAVKYDTWAEFALSRNTRISNK
jgi:hypothetical protein